MKKLISIMLVAVCVLSLAACGNREIEATVKPFPEFKGVDFDGIKVSNDIFKDYDVTVVNFWSNGCGSCIAEMPDLETYYQKFKEKKINLVGVAVSSGDSTEERARAKSILKEKGVTYQNVIPEKESEFYKDFIGTITGYPITYLVDGEGNIVGAPLVGVVKNQEDLLIKRLDKIISSKTTFN